MKVTLRLTAGPEAGRIFEFNEAETFLVGRSPKAHLRFDVQADRAISRTHCLIEIRPPRCILWDLDSRNGTYVNSQRIKQIDLKDGDIVQVGKTRIHVAMQEGLQARTMIVPCVGCGRKLSVRADSRVLKRKGHIVCRSCLEKEKERRRLKARAEAKAAGKSAPARPAAKAPLRKYSCAICEKDLTGRANLDSMADKLKNALYFCETCAAGRQSPEQKDKTIGDYLILGVVGQGGMGIVYKAVHQVTGRLCALKMILPELVMSEYATKVFEREIQVQSKVIHPNLVRILARGRSGRNPFFVTEFMAGKDVKNLVEWEVQGPLEPALAVEITIQVLTGLQGLHKKGFIHRDLKPSNYLLDRPYTEPGFLVKIADYGLAKSFENAGNSIFEYTKEGVSAGSYVYIPPEQITNYKYVKPPVDVYAVGVSLYWMLTGRYSVDFSSPSDGSPQSGSTGKPRHPLEIVLEEQAIPVLKRKAGLPKSLARVVDRAVMKDVDKRFQSADEFRMELEKVAAEQGWRPQA